MRIVVVATTLALVLSGCSDAATDPLPRAAATPATAATPAATATPASSPDAAPPTVSTPAAVPSPEPSLPVALPAPLPSRGPADPLVPRPGLESPAPLGEPTCRAQDLSMVDADAIVTPETVHEVFVLRTTGPECQLEGFPQLQLRDAGGTPLALTVTRNGFGLPVEQAEPFSLSRSTSLSFRVASPRGGTCRPVASIVATLPGAGGPLTAESFLTACGDTVGVSPVERGGSDH